MAGHNPHHPRLDLLRTAFWGLAGTLVLIGVFAAALGDLQPSEGEILIAALCVLAVVWAAHEWRLLWRDEKR